MSLILAAALSCCGAGTAADTEKTTDLVASNLTIFSLNSGRKPRVVMAVNILQDLLYRCVLDFQSKSLDVRSLLWSDPGCPVLQVPWTNRCQSDTGRSGLYWEPPVHSGAVRQCGQEALPGHGYELWHCGVSATYCMCCKLYTFASQTCLHTKSVCCLFLELHLFI